MLALSFPEVHRGSHFSEGAVLRTLSTSVLWALLVALHWCSRVLVLSSTIM